MSSAGYLVLPILASYCDAGDAGDAVDAGIQWHPVYGDISVSQLACQSEANFGKFWARIDMLVIE